MAARGLEGSGKEVRIVTGPAGNSPFDTVLDAMRVTTVASAGAAAGAFATLGKAVGTSAVQLSAASVPSARGLLLKAAPGNSGVVYAGAAGTVTAGGTDATDGYPLAAGQELFLPVDDLNKVWLIASASAQKVFALIA